MLFVSSFLIFMKEGQSENEMGMTDMSIFHRIATRLCQPKDTGNKYQCLLLLLYVLTTNIQ